VNKYDVVINFNGNISLPVIDDILHKLKVYLHNNINDKLIRKRVYSLAVECLDNIFKHSDLTDINNKLVNKYPPKFIVEFFHDTFLIHTGNIISNENTEKVIQKLTQLNKLADTEVNQLYKDSLSNAEISEKGGAGLGLIVMAKTTRQKIHFDFERINHNFSYFAMQLNLKIN
jgi:type I site-specific restriction endonuclease